ncbi:YozQ family protein [Terribacillus sp. 7520-G]|uniref:YozQ family protein n=1 Tax=Terribacillus TaxID=459532 RepID=UPI001E4C382D|nr:YozQ family protein [Terribacillus sp. 7520-G]
MDKSKQKAANEVAEKMYDAQNHDSSNPVDKGISITHEQVTDTYTEGTVDGKIDNVEKDGSLTNGKDREIPREGF